VSLAEQEWARVVARFMEACAWTAACEGLTRAQWLRLAEGVWLARAAQVPDPSKHCMACFAEGWLLPKSGCPKGHARAAQGGPDAQGSEEGSEPVREEVAVYACRHGHEQEHSGSCDSCRKVTDLVRWEPLAKPGGRP
jgi:hypothetical protein